MNQKDMADDTAAVMKELGLKDICVFGASQGGMYGPSREKSLING